MMSFSIIYLLNDLISHRLPTHQECCYFYNYHITQVILLLLPTTFSKTYPWRTHPLFRVVSNLFPKTETH